MVDLKHSDMRIVEEAFQADPGYVLNFSDRTCREFFQDEIGIDIDDERYRAAGTSKMNRLRTFLRIEDPNTVAKTMRALCEYRDTHQAAKPLDGGTKAKLFALIGRIESRSTIAKTDAIERFVADETLEELVAAIERDILADKPGTALDRLHTYCMKKFSHLLDKRGIAWGKDEPLHSRFGKYVKAVQQDRVLGEMTVQILKNSIGVFDKFNHIRNNRSLAHDNELLEKAEARFIFDSISATLHFVKAIDTVRFGA